MKHLPKKGDVVSLHAMLTYDVEPEDLFVHLKIDGDTSTIYAPVSAIQSIVSLKLEEGDTVVSPDGLGEIIALKDGWAWVKQTEAQTFGTWAVEVLTRPDPAAELEAKLDPPPPAPAPIPALCGPDGETIVVAAQPEF